MNAKTFERALQLCVLLFLMMTLFTLACRAQPAQRIMLTQLEQSKTVEGTKAGQIGLTNAAGDQRYAQYVEISATPIVYVPTPTGNLNNLSEFVEDSLSRIWYIDWQGNAVLLNDPATCDQDWLRISDNGCPEALTDSLYKYKYASIGARYVWPNAEFLVSDSVAPAVQVLNGNRNARQGFHDNINGTNAMIDFGGSQMTTYIPSTADGGVFQIATSTGNADVPFIQTRHVSVNAADSTFQLHQYPNTLNDPGTPVNVLTTAVNGKVESHPVSEVIAAGGGVSGTIAAGQVAFGTGVNTIGGSATNTYASAASGNNATGSYVGPTLTATANNDVYSTMQINADFVPGAFTGTKPFILSLSGSSGSSWPFIGFSEGLSVNPPYLQFYRNTTTVLSDGTLRSSYTGSSIAVNATSWSASSDNDGFQIAGGTSNVLLVTSLLGTGDLISKATGITRTTNRFRGNLYAQELISGSDEDAASPPVSGIVRSGKKNVAGSGTDITGSNLTMQSGGGTGNNSSNGDIIFQTPDVTVSGTALQAYTTKAIIKRSGFVGIGESNPTSTVHINGSNGYTQLRLQDNYTPTSSADANGLEGDIAKDDDYIYLKTSTGWKRAALTSW